MLLSMRVKLFFRLQGQLAHKADVALLDFAVLQFVLGQRGPGREGLITDVALEACGVGVNLHVFVALCLVPECLAAECARHWMTLSFR